jgi:hypothetical protein
MYGVRNAAVITLLATAAAWLMSRKILDGDRIETPETAALAGCLLAGGLSASVPVASGIPLACAAPVAALTTFAMTKKGDSGEIPPDFIVAAAGIGVFGWFLTKGLNRIWK